MDLEKATPKPKHRRRSRTPINKALIAQDALDPAQRLSPAALAETFNVPVQVIYDQIIRLRRKGKLADPRASKPIEPTPPESATDMDAEHRALLARIASGAVPDRDERRRMLARIAATGNDTNARAAIKDLETMDVQVQRKLGPAPPSTREDAKRRVTRMLLACPPDLALEIWADYQLQLPKELVA